jgi:hypothetical protein
MTWDIDLVCGMRVYSNQLQINFEFYSVEWFLANLQLLDFEIWPNIKLSPLVFAMLEDIDLICGIWVHSDELQNKAYISFRCNDIWPSYGPWILKLGQIFSSHHFISLWFEILTLIVAWECIIICCRSTLKFIPVQWILVNL